MSLLYHAESQLVRSVVTVSRTLPIGPMPHYSPSSNPVLTVPGTARAREDGRLEVQIVGLGTPSFVIEPSPSRYVCSMTGKPQEAGSSLVRPFALQPALKGLGISPDGWALLERSGHVIPLMMWPQNRDIYF